MKYMYLNNDYDFEQFDYASALIANQWGLLIGIEISFI